MAGIKTGIHFGDGKQAVEEFRSSIIGLAARLSWLKADR